MKRELIISSILCIILCSCALQRQSPISRKLFVSQNVPHNDKQVTKDTLQKSELDYKTDSIVNMSRIEKLIRQTAVIAEQKNKKVIPHKSILEKLEKPVTGFHPVRTMLNHFEERLDKLVTKDKQNISEEKTARKFRLIALGLMLLILISLGLGIVLFEVFEWFFIGAMLALFAFFVGVTALVFSHLALKYFRKANITDRKTRVKFYVSAKFVLVILYILTGISLMFFMLSMILWGNSH